MSRRNSSGFTLVELLVVIAIIGILVALLLPAIQAAREAARRSQCQNHLKQLVTGVLLHESAHKHLPVGGYDPEDSGDPDLGAGVRQKGGWCYNLMPFIEEDSLYELGAGLPRGPQKFTLFMQRDRTPVTIYYCPTRRPARAVRVAAGPNDNHTGGLIDVAGRCDYAMSVGDATGDYDTDNPAVPIKNQRTGVTWHSENGTNGIQSVLFKLRRFTDGTSKTYCVGEALLSPDTYDNGTCANADWPANNGFQDDTVRSAGYNAFTYRNGHPPMQDTPGVACGGFTPPRYAFGSAHSAGFYMAYCDGSVQLVSYDIDLETHRQNAHNSDGGARTDVRP